MTTKLAAELSNNDVIVGPSGDKVLVRGIEAAPASHVRVECWSGADTFYLPADTEVELAHEYSGFDPYDDATALYTENDIPPGQWGYTFDGDERFGVVTLDAPDKYEACRRTYAIEHVVLHHDSSIIIDTYIDPTVEVEPGRWRSCVERW